MKASLTILLLLVSQGIFAGSSKIVPENKAQLIRAVGDSVYVECKKAGPYSTNCQIDCGNGRRFSKASGYCYFMRPGTFLLTVSTRYRNKNILHTATVIVKDEINRPAVARTLDSSVVASDEPDNDQLSVVTSTARQNIPREETQFTQNLRDAEELRRVSVQNNFNQADIQNNANNFGRDSLPPGGGFSGNDASQVDQNANRVVLR